MDNHIKFAFEKSKSGDKDKRYERLSKYFKWTNQKVDWAYEVWSQLTHKDNHQCSRAAQYLANLAKSDPEVRIVKDFPKLWEVTKNEMSRWKMKRVYK